MNPSEIVKVIVFFIHVIMGLWITLKVIFDYDFLD
jgi:hypothetical protein